MLIKKLAELQNELKQTDIQFAEGIGLRYEYWNSIRNRHCNQRRLHKLHRMVRTYLPDLVPFIDAPLPPGDSGLVPYWKKLPKQRTTRPSLHQIRKLHCELESECYFCGSTVGLHRHHKDLQGQGSSDPHHTLDNLVALCAHCHHKLHRLIRAVEGRFKAAVANPEITLHLKLSKRLLPKVDQLIDMALRDVAGEPLESIGQSYGLTRQRVQQILKQAAG